MLIQTAIFLAAAVLAVPLFKRLGLGAVLGYLAAGVLIGPSVLGLVRHVEDTLHFAEFGVVLLLFLIGLELQPSRLWKIRADVFGLGSLQVLLTSLVLMGLSIAWCQSFTTGAIVGFSLSLSSTAMAIQLLGEKNELATPHGRAAFGVLLFQDLAAIPALAIIPMIAVQRGETSHTYGGWVQLLLVISVLVTLALGGRFVLRPFFRIVASARSHELSAASALLVVLGTALLMQTIGLSMALGAFLAGVLLADSEYRHELEANIEPFKGLLLGLFFIAVGMSADLSVIVSSPWLVLRWLLAIVVVKAFVLWGIAHFKRLPRHGASGFSIALCQGGEFAFVLFGVARHTETIPHDLVEVLTVSVTLSMALTPIAFALRDKFSGLLSGAKDDRPFDVIEEQNPVIIAGFGRFGQIIARVLRIKHIRFTALEVNATQVDFVRKFGNKIYYGDASRVDLLRAAGAEQARLFMLCIDDPESSIRTAKIVQAHFPHLTIFARARNRQHAFALMGLGIERVYRETFATSLETARDSLIELGLTTSEARETVKRFRDFDQSVLAEQFTLRDDEQALIESAKKVSQDLERLFEADAQQPV